MPTLLRDTEEGLLRDAEEGLVHSRTVLSRATFPKRTVGPNLHVDRGEIGFFTAAPDRVRIEVVVRNIGDRPSDPTWVRLEAAPLGAFLPWQPLAALALPALDPGGSASLEADVSFRSPAPLGGFATVPPRRLLTALGMEGPPARPDRPPTLLQRLAGPFRRSRGEASRGPGPQLPPDPLQLLSRGNPHWAGNLNVFVGHRAVERHLARALRVYPGRTNLALFCVGCGRDAYAFTTSGPGTAWNPALFDATSASSFIVDPRRMAPLRESTWIETEGCRVMILAVSPPQNCQEGALEVHVIQRSTGKEALVEFSLDPEAAGPGCYVV